jgi:hypothetical protein
MLEADVITSYAVNPSLVTSRASWLAIITYQDNRSAYLPV